MRKRILVAGATGNLGGKIVNALIEKGADVYTLARPGTDNGKIHALKVKGVKVLQVDTNNIEEVSKACTGIDCVVSALSGLREVIIDTQKVLLDAAIMAKVPRFIPSDFSLDFTNLVAGKNRNLDLRREFHAYMEKRPISATTIFNGPFMDLLTGDMPLIMFKIKRILYWGNPDQLMDFTTTYNVATFTANAALDPDTPRYLYIAGDRISSRQMGHVVSEVTQKKFRILKAGSLGVLEVLIKVAKRLAPGKGELYPAWQGMEYMRDMVEGRAKIAAYDNQRYADMNWTTVKQFLLALK